MDTGWLDTAPEELLSLPVVPEEAARLCRAPAVAAARPTGGVSPAPPAPLLLPVVDEEGERHGVTAWSDHVLPATTDGARAWVAVRGETHVFERPDGSVARGPSHAGDADVTAPMPGTVIAVEAEQGDTGRRPDSGSAPSRR